jgi:hypothetical protein
MANLMKEYTKLCMSGISSKNLDAEHDNHHDSQSYTDHKNGMSW